MYQILSNRVTYLSRNSDYLVCTNNLFQVTDQLVDQAQTIKMLGEAVDNIWKNVIIVVNENNGTAQVRSLIVCILNS